MQHYTSVLPAGGTVTINAHHWDAMLLWVTNTSGGVNPVSVFGRVGTANLIQVVNGYNLAAAAPWPLMMFSKGGQPVSFATIPPAAGTIAAMLPLFDNLTITLTNAGTVNYAGWAA